MAHTVIIKSENSGVGANQAKTRFAPDTPREECETMQDTYLRKKTTPTKKPTPTRILRKPISFLMAFILSVCFLPIGAAPAFAAVGDYDPGDIDVINRIIADNGLSWTPAPVDGSSVPGDLTENDLFLQIIE